MNSIATPEPVIAAAIFVSVAGVVLLSMLGFLIRWLIKEPVGVMLLHYHPTKVQGRTLLADPQSLELASRRLQDVVIKYD